MRKVTHQAYNAWVNRKPFKKGNTRVEIYPNKKLLYLHDNCIAKEENSKLYINHCDWETPTTRERLNMFPGVHIRINKGSFILNEEKVMESGWNLIN